jgi:hypothetical protein
MEHHRFGQFEVRREEPLHHLWWVSAAGCYALPMVTYKSQEHVRTENLGHRHNSFAFKSESSYVSKEYNFNKINITACINLYLPIWCLLSIYRNSVVRSWDPSAMNGLTARFNKIFFFEQLSKRLTRKFAWLAVNWVRYLKQYLPFSDQQILLFLSTMLNWSIEGNRPLHALPVILLPVHISLLSTVTIYSSFFTYKVYYYSWIHCCISLISVLCLCKNIFFTLFQYITKTR